MGYSCTQAAHSTLAVLESFCRKSTGSSNMWKDEAGREFFFEVGPEQDDGRIVGTIHELTNGLLAHHRGGFRIDSDGMVKSFPHVPAQLRHDMQREGVVQAAFQRGESFVVA